MIPNVLVGRSMSGYEFLSRSLVGGSWSGSKSWAWSLSASVYRTYSWSGSKLRPESECGKNNI
jgi:hypothetical protein